MAFKIFDKTVKGNQVQKSKIPFVTINERGKFNFSQAARRSLSLEEGDRVIFHQDLEFRSDWYVRFTKEKQGYKLVFGQNDTRLTASYPAAEIFKSIGKVPQKLTFPIKVKPLVLNNIACFSIDTLNPIK